MTLKMTLLKQHSDSKKSTAQKVYYVDTNIMFAMHVSKVHENIRPLRFFYDNEQHKQYVENMYSKNKDHKQHTLCIKTEEQK